MNRKRKAELRRRESAQERAREEQALRAKFESLINMKSGLGVRADPKPKERSYTGNASTFRRGAAKPERKPLPEPQDVMKLVKVPLGMEEREAKAQQEIDKKRKRVAVAYNKGAYQYITDETDPKTLGRK